MKWENQNVFTSWMPRGGALILAAIGLIMFLRLMTGDIVGAGRTLFLAAVVVGFVPWLLFALWLSARSTPIRSIELDAATASITVTTHASTVTFPISAARATLSRGLLWVEGPADWWPLRRAYVFALFDRDLSGFIQCAHDAGLGVGTEWGTSLPDYLKPTDRSAT